MARLAEIESRHAATCQLCAVSGAKGKLVFGEGAPDAEIMFVGEVPGEPEERVGRPFMGLAGEKLDEMIRAMGLTRADVYIASVLKSRLPGDRAPTPEDIAACGPYLLEQVLAVQPRVLVTLGGPATKWIWGAICAQSWRGLVVLFRRVQLPPTRKRTALQLRMQLCMHMCTQRISNYVPSTQLRVQLRQQRKRC
jgi:DNA polymerase